VLSLSSTPPPKHTCTHLFKFVTSRVDNDAVVLGILFHVVHRLLKAQCVHLTTPPEELGDGRLVFVVGGLLAFLLAPFFLSTSVFC